VESVGCYRLRATWLNDRFELDGRDQRLHRHCARDLGQAQWRLFERPVFAQVLYMSLASAGGEFDSKSYIARIGELEQAHVYALDRSYDLHTICFAVAASGSVFTARSVKTTLPSRISEAWRVNKGTA